jgi:hypothetical protein
MYCTGPQKCYIGSLSESSALRVFYTLTCLLKATLMKRLHLAGMLMMGSPSVTDA